jgi:hypothetical protein
MKNTIKKELEKTKDSIKNNMDASQQIEKINLEILENQIDIISIKLKEMNNLKDGLFNNIDNVKLLSSLNEIDNYTIQLLNNCFKFIIVSNDTIMGVLNDEHRRLNRLENQMIQYNKEIKNNKEELK